MIICDGEEPAANYREIRFVDIRTHVLSALATI